MNKELTFEDRIKEFYNIKNLTKFNSYFYNMFLFSDGSKMYSWYKSNKDEIFSRKDFYCEGIRKQYLDYKNRTNINRQNGMSELYVSIRGETLILEEFLNINDLSKFDSKSQIKLSNGDNSYDWFIKNKNMIFNGERGIHKKIQKQYLTYKKRKLLLDFKKDELFFVRLNDKLKFDRTSNVVLPSGTTSGTWFDKNKVELEKNNNNPIAKMIMEQYEEYKNIMELLYDFYKEPGLAKFDFDSNARFKSGALMNLFWELWKEEILTKRIYLFEVISNQYDKYLHINDSKKILKK